MKTRIKYLILDYDGGGGADPHLNVSPMGSGKKKKK